jgi:hypothetical protein
MFIIKHLKCIDCGKDVYYQPDRDLYLCISAYCDGVNK